MIDQRRIRELDGLRGVAAVAVMWAHGPAFSVGATSPGNQTLWVDFFFVLSGFVMARGYGDRLKTGMSRMRFIWLRLARLYPLHLAMLVVAVGYEVGKWLLYEQIGIRAAAPPFDKNNFGSLATNLALVHAVGSPVATWNAPSWSISAEFLSYCLFAFFARWPKLFAAAAFAIGASVCIAGGRYLSVESDLGLFRCLTGFGLGVAIHCIAWPRVISFAPLLLSPVALAIIVLPTYETAWTLLAPPVFALIIAGLVSGDSALGRPLRTGPLQWLGARSYAIYMVHYIVAVVLFNFERLGLDMGPLLTPLYFGISLLIADLAHRFIETPANRWLTALTFRAKRPEIVEEQRSAP